MPTSKENTFVFLLSERIICVHVKTLVQNNQRADNGLSKCFQINVCYANMKAKLTMANSAKLVELIWGQNIVLTKIQSVANSFQQL